MATEFSRTLSLLRQERGVSQRTAAKDLGISQALLSHSHSNITLLMVTHDRYFLDRVCTDIFELDEHSLYTYHGNYAYYMEKRAERIETQNAEVEKARNLYRTELEWMRRMPQARAHKAQYRIDSFYELEKKAKQQRTESDVRLAVKSGYIGNKIFEAKDVCKTYKTAMWYP